MVGFEVIRVKSPKLHVVNGQPGVPTARGADAGGEEEAAAVDWVAAGSRPSGTVIGYSHSGHEDRKRLAGRRRTRAAHRVRRGLQQTTRMDLSRLTDLEGEAVGGDAGAHELARRLRMYGPPPRRGTPPRRVRRMRHRREYTAGMSAVSEPWSLCHPHSRRGASSSGSAVGVRDAADGAASAAASGASRAK